MRRFLQVLLLLSLLSDGQADRGCTIQDWPMGSFSLPGDVLIGGLLVVHSGYKLPQLSFQELPPPISCTGFHIRYYRDVLGLVFAIHEINLSSDLLPNITLGLSVLDSCMSELRAILGALVLISGTHNPLPGYDCHSQSVMVGIVGEMFSALSLPVARTLGVLNYPQISPGSTLSTLSQKRNFPSFLRTVPSNMFQNIALSQLIARFGWTWVGMLVVDNDVGEQGGQVIRTGIETSGGCVAFLEKIHLSYTMKDIMRVVKVIKESSVNIIVLHSPEVHVKALLEILYDEDVTNKNFIASASFGFTSGLFSRKAWKVLNGTIGFAPKTGDMPGFLEFLNNLHPSNDSDYPFIKLFWEKAFNCKWSDGGSVQQTLVQSTVQESEVCTGNEKLSDLVPSLFEIWDLSYTYHAYLAVYAYAYSLQELLRCPSGYIQNNTCGAINSIHPWQVLRSLKKTSFRPKSGDWTTFNSNGDIPATYDIMNIQILNDTFNLVKVGRFDPNALSDDQITLNIGIILWNKKFTHVPLSVCSNSCNPGFRKAARVGQPRCCFDCLSCSVGEVANTSDSVECLKCPGDQWSSEERDRCVPKVIEFLSYQEPLGIMLVTLVVVFSLLTLCILFIFMKNQDTPVIKATNRELSYLLLVSLTLCFLCCLVFIGPPSAFTCLIRQSLFSVVFSVSISSVLAKTIMVIVAFKTTNLNSPLRKCLGPCIPRHVVGFCSMFQATVCSVWLIISPPFPKLNTESTTNKMTFECYEGQKFFFYVTLGFMGFLAMVSFFAAFLARNIPGSFNEAKLITFSMLVFCSVWISFIPAYLSTNGKYTVAVQIFAMLASSAGLLGCIFVPKCFIILLRPERNNREYLASKKKMRNFG